MADIKNKTASVVGLLGDTETQGQFSANSNPDLVKKTKPIKGRPSSYTEDKAHEILTRLSNGESLRQICKDKHLPSFATVFNWKDAHPDFLDKYTRATASRATYYAEEAFHIADRLTDDDGKLKEGLDALSIAAAREQIHIRQWAAARMAPANWAENKHLAITQDINVKLADRLREGQARLERRVVSEQ